jgi:hypothetical protein
VAAFAVAAFVAGCISSPTPEASSVPVATLAAASATASPSASPSTTLPAPSATPHVATKPAPCPGTDKTPRAAPGRQVLGSSSNWSGYVAAVKKTGVTCVEASWVEPSVTCPKTGHQAVAIWIGIDGFAASTLGIPATDVLVQIGTQVDCRSGVASHSFWREILPGEPTEVPIPGRLRAGDHISARISHADGEFTLVIFDAEALGSYTLIAPAPGAPRKTAEWIVEAPAANCPDACKIVPLPKFSTITFTDAHATIAGQRAAINNDSWTNVKLKMVRSGITRATTSRLLSSGTSFRITFIHT